MKSSRIDAGRGKVVWDTKVPGDPLGGATVVNDLVCTALLDGTVIALDATRQDRLEVQDGRRHQRLAGRDRRHPLRAGRPNQPAATPRARLPRS